MDQRLAALMRFYMQGPIGDEHMPAQARREIGDLLAGPPGEQRDLYLQHLWFSALGLLNQEYFHNESTGQALWSMNSESRHIFLTLYGRRGPNAARGNDGQITRARVVAGMLMSARGAIKTSSGKNWQLPDPQGKRSGHLFEMASPSGDAPEGIFFATRGTRINQVATYTFVWGKGFQYWRYRFARDGKVGKSERVTQVGATENIVLVNPKI